MLNERRNITVVCDLSLSLSLWTPLRRGNNVQHTLIGMEGEYIDYCVKHGVVVF